MLVFTADTHLHPYAWASLPAVCGDSYRSWEQIVDWTISHQASGLVLGGDVFDTQPPADAVEVFLRGIRRLQAAGIPVYAIQGQHGRNRDIPWTSIDPYVVWLHGRSIKVDGHTVGGFDNLSPEEMKEALRKLDPEVDVLVLHQMCRGTVPEIAGCQNWDLDPEWIPVTVKLVLLGDFHEPWEHNLTRPIGNNILSTTKLMYSGSICMQSINEPPNKSFLAIHSNGWIERIPLQTRPFHMVHLLAEEQMAENLAAVAKLTADSLCCIRFDPRIAHVEKVFREANPSIHFMFRPLPISTETSPVDMKKLGEVSLEGCLSLMVDRESDPEFHSFVLSLLRSNKPRDVIEAERVKRFPVEVK